MSIVIPGADIGTSSRESCICATTTNITIPTDLEVGDIIDGVTLVAGDRVLVKDQTSAVENGVYEVQATPPTFRAPDFEENVNVGGAVVVVREGTTNGDTIWACTTDPPNDITSVDDLSFRQTAGNGVDGNVNMNGPVNDNRIVRTDGTSGNIIQESGIDLDDTNNISNLGYIQFNDVTSPATPSAGQGRLYKKTGNSGIFWIDGTLGIEIDLTAGSTGGESNTAANVGNAGVGLFKTKVGVVLNFKNIAPASSRINITDDVANDNVTIDVSESNVDHDNLLNFESNEHVNHTSVSINAGIGLSGGGDISATRTINLDIPSLTFEATVDPAADYVALYDSSASAHRRTFVLDLVKMTNVGVGGVGVYKQRTGVTFELKNINAFEGLQVVDDVANDEVDLGLDVNSLPTLTTPDPTNDWIPIYDTSAGVHKKIQIDDVVAGSNIGAVAIFKDEKPQGTDGGDFIDGVWVIRTLNTLTGNLSGASLTSNVMTIPAGTYYVNGTAPARDVKEHAARLYNITNSTVQIAGTSEYTKKTSTSSKIVGYITIGTSTQFRVEHRCDNDEDDDGLGRATGFNNPEVYTIITFTKLS